MNKAELDRLYELEKQIRSIEREKDRLYDAQINITSRISPTPGGGGERDQLAEYVASIDALDADLAKIVLEHAALYLRYKRAVRTLKPRERTVLRLRYEECLGWRRIAGITHYSQRRVQGIHAESLKKLESGGY